MSLPHEFYEDMKQIIEQHGRQIIYVADKKPSKNFAYTIGNHLTGSPELLVLGKLAPKDATQLLNCLSSMFGTTKRQFGNGEFVSLLGACPVQVWDAAPIAQAEYTIQASQFYSNDNYAVQQIMIPDKGGRYPPNCLRQYRVPLLRATAHIMQSLRQH